MMADRRTFGTGFFAFSGNEKERAEQMARLGHFIMFNQPCLGERRKQHLAGWITGEGSARAVCPLLAGREAYDSEPGVRISKSRHRRVPEIGEFRAAGMAGIDKARTQGAIERGFDVGQGA
jgi:hypothetical protein